MKANSGVEAVVLGPPGRWQLSLTGPSLHGDLEWIAAFYAAFPAECAGHVLSLLGLLQPQGPIALLLLWAQALHLHSPLRAMVLARGSGVAMQHTFPVAAAFEFLVPASGQPIGHAALE